MEQEQDSNNNSQVSNEVSTDNSKTDHENTPAAVEGEIKPESSSIIESCAGTHPPTTSTENGSSAEPAVEAADSKPQTKVSESKDSKSSLSSAKPGLKAVPKPSGMSRPGGKAAPTGARGAMAAFKQMDTANNPSSASAPKPKFTSGGKGGQPSVVESLLRWCQLMTREYENVKIDNFSTSWNNGLAFLALIHHFYPDSFSWDKVDERRRRENFQLAFDLAEQKADIAPLLDVEDMVRMKKPDWKCVFTYVQSFYRKLRDHENNKHSYAQQ